MPAPCALEVRVMGLAWFKAAQLLETQVRSRLPHGGDTGSPDADAIILAADTLCELDGDIIGKPRDERDARAVLERLQARSHRTCTGVCAVDRRSGRRQLFADVAIVTLGRLTTEQVEAHLAGGAWRGKAGGYNFADQVAAGWPLRCEGDPTSVMGLPMRRVRPLLDALLRGRGAA